MTQQEERPVGPKNHERQPLQELIGDRVLCALGEPGDLHRVQVRRLWDGHFRVNVFVGGDATSALVAHSFFVVADDDGNILRAVPALTRQY
jgi:hypothetical protein